MKPLPLLSPPACTLAGTPSAAPAALWQAVCATQTDMAAWPLQICEAAEAASPAIFLTGTWFWLPTPTAAPASERTLEQTWRAALMDAAMQGHITLRVLYGLPHHQRAALSECLRSTAPSVSGALPSGKGQHLHTAGMRCRECVDPQSERTLFTRLLQGRTNPAPPPN